MHRIVIKFGTSSLVADGALDAAKLDRLGDAVAELMAGGDMPVLVTSGAIALGRSRLSGLPRARPLCPQVAAAVGQSALFEAFRECLDRRGIPTAQFLLTPPDLVEEVHRAGVRAARDRALDWGIVPVVNENDAIAVRNNDILAALLSAVVGARRLLLLTDVAGLYQTDPRRRPAAQPIRELRLPSPEVERLAMAPVDGVGTGGMTTKLCAAWIAASAGVTTVIASAAEPDVVLRAARGEEIGTLVHPQRPSDDEPDLGRLWRALAALPAGRVVCDELTADVVARHAAIHRSRVVEVVGEFLAGDPIDVVAPGGRLLARGRTRLGARSLASAASHQLGPSGQGIVLEPDDYVSLVEVEVCR